MKKNIIRTTIGPDGRVFFECDRHACETCRPECFWTSKREHAVAREMEFPDGVEVLQVEGGPRA